MLGDVNLDNVICFDDDTRRTTIGDRRPCMEFSSNFGQGNPVTACMRSAEN